MKRIAYVRVSTPEQRHDRQIQGLRHLADELHIETISALAQRRPIYDHVVSRLKSGDTLLLWAIDRAYRSTKDALIEIEALRSRGVRIEIGNFPLDTETPQGRFVLTVMSGMAQLEHEVLVQRTKEGIAAARANGKTLGRPPKLTPIQLFEAHCRIAAKEATCAQIAAEYRIAPWTLTRAIKRSLANPAQ